MKHFIAHRVRLRQILVPLLGMSLLLYFSYYMSVGDRSIIRLMSLQKEHRKLSADYNVIRVERIALENKVKRLRPESMDRDFLEERARAVLGYVHEDEKILLLPDKG